MHHGRRVLLAIAIALATAGCGSSGSGATTGLPSPAPATPGAPAASTATGEATAVASATDASAGGGGVCDLATGAELAQALGRDVQTTLVSGPPDTCGFAATDGTPLGAMVLLTSGGGAVFGAVHQGSNLTDLSGIGDRAFYSTEMQTLTVLKGDALLTISVVSAQTDDERRGIETAIATASAPRM